jgi:NDP-sugar pyrophosphorylase family protein
MLTIVMPMAGLGSRFRDTGEERPKPLIDAGGTPMFLLALGSLAPLLPQSQVIAVVLAEHAASSGIKRALEDAHPGISVAEAPKLTGGALETCLLAAPLAKTPGAPLVVLDCDLTFDAPNWLQRLRALAEGKDSSDGLLLSFRSSEPCFSYAETRGDRVVRTAEKQVISDRALIGAYGFRSADLFFSVARDIVSDDERVGGEYYTSSAYNRMIRQGLTVGIADAERYWSLGTPAQLARAKADKLFSSHVVTIQDCLSRLAHE